MRDLWLDLRYACRTLARAPLFTAVVILTLALGIGANSAIFSIVNAVLLDGTPFDHPGRLVSLQVRSEKGYRGAVSLPNYHDWQRSARVFSSIAAASIDGFTIAGSGGAEHVQATLMIGDLFGTLGVRPRLGRAQTASETERGAAPTAVLSYAFWRREYGGARSVIGRTITLDDRPYTIIGVAPPSMDYPYPQSDLYVPAGASPNLPWDERASTFGLRAIARVRSGVTLGMAQLDMDRVTREIRDRTGDATTVRVQALRDTVIGGVEPAMLDPSGAVALVLFIACANIAALLIARGESRQREMAVRSALGAGALRLMRQLCTETLVLAVAGGAAGLIVAWLGIKAFGHALPATLPVVPPSRLSTPVLAFTGLVTVATALAVGLIPALRVVRAQEAGDALSACSARAGDGAHRVRLRTVLVTTEIALSVVLLVGAVLALRSVAAMRAVDPGFDARGVVTMRVAPDDEAYAELARWIALYRDILARTRALPGVEATGLLNAVPLFSGSYDANALPEGRADTRDNREASLVLSASPDLFRTLGIALVRGRPFTIADSRTSTPVAIVDETMARRFWPNENPIGKRLQWEPAAGGAASWREVVGVVRNIHYYQLERQARITAYRPVAQADSSDAAPNFYLFVKTRGDPQAAVAQIRRVITGIDASTAVYYVQTMDQVVNQYLATAHLLERVLGLFAGLALILAAVGTYGLMAYTVAFRTRELGIRMALGATVEQAVGIVMRRGLAITAVGVACGVGGALVASRALSASLFGVTPLDPVGYVVAGACLAIVATTATWMSARRVTRIPSGIALRSE